MRREEELLQKFVKENDLTGLDFSWGTSVDRYYIAYVQSGEETHIHYNTENEKIISRVGYK